MTPQTSPEQAIAYVDRINKYHDSDIADAAGELLKAVAAESGERGDIAIIALEHLYRYTSHRKTSFEAWLTYHEPNVLELVASARG